MYRLFIDSSTGIDVEPDPDYSESAEKIENRHRTRSAAEYVYKWSSYKIFEVPVSFVDSSFKAIVNSWWENNVDLKWMKEGDSVYYDVRIANRKAPIDEFISPYDTLFTGTIDLESY